MKHRGNPELAGTLSRSHGQRRLGRGVARAAGAAALFGALAAGCAAREVPPAAVTATVTQRGDTTVLTLSASPTVAALAMPTRDSVPARVERVALPDTVTDAFIQDVAALPDGRYALLLRDLFQIAVLRDGAVERWFGRAGKGPGEFVDPLAIEARADGFAVLDLFGVQVFSPTGQVLEAVRLPWVPDWRMSFNRRPLLQWGGRYQAGPEDVTRRLARRPGGYAVFASEAMASLDASPQGPAKQLPMSLLAISPGGGTAAEAGALMGPERTAHALERSMPKDALPQYDEPLFEPRPLVAGTDSWLAVFDPARAAVEVTPSAGVGPLVVRWTATPVAVSDTMRVQYINHQFTELARLEDESEWKGRIERFSFSEKLEHAEQDAFSTVLAPLAALYADGDCLWLLGVDPRDFTDGTSHWGLAVNVRTHTVRGPVRLARRGMRVREVGGGYAWSVVGYGRVGGGLERVALPACRK